MATAVNKALFYSPGDQGTGGVSFMPDNLAPQSGSNQVRKITTTDELAAAFRDYYSNQVYRLAYAQEQLNKGIDFIQSYDQEGRPNGGTSGAYSRYNQGARQAAYNMYKSTGSLTPDKITGANVLDLIGKTGWSGGVTPELTNWTKGVSAPSGTIYMSPEEARANGINPTGNSNGYYDANIVKDTAAYKAKIASGELVPTGEKFANGEPMYTSKNKPSGAGTPKLTKTLDFGARGEEVKDLQKWLISNGYKISEATGYYGNETKAAVTAWQNAIGLNPGAGAGTFGPRSLAAANGGQAGSPSSSTNTGQQTSSSSTNTGQQTASSSTNTGQQTSSSPTNADTRDANGLLINPPDAKFDRNTGHTIGFDSWRTEGLTTYDDTQEMTKEDAYERLKSGLINAKTLTNISSAQIEKVKQDPALLAFYVGALSYGEYTLGDVYKDVKRRELINAGHKEYENMMPISGELDRSAYAQTDDGRLANNNPEFKAMKMEMGNIDPSIFNLPLFDVPDEMFKQLVPILNPSTPEYRAEIEKIQSVYYDLSKAVIEANTEQARTYAVDQLNKAKEIISRTYGIQLSNNANEAWKQIETLGSSAAQAGISGSGIQNEAVDDMLRSVRQKDEQSRVTKLTEEETKMSEYYRKFGTSDEINKLIEEDKAKGLPRDQWRATKLGLVPSQDVLNSLDINMLKQKYPDFTEEKLRRMVGNVVDQNGNYRSSLYVTKQNDMESALQDKEIKSSTEYTSKQDALNKEASQEFDRDEQNPFILPKISTTPAPTTTPTPVSQPVAPTQQPTQYAGGLPPDDPKNAFNTATGQANPNYKPSGTAAAIQSATTNIQNSLSGTGSTTPATPAKTGYQGVSLVDYLSSVGQDSSTANRAKLAAANGITGYSATAGDPTGTLNTALLKKLRGY